MGYEPVGRIEPVLPGPSLLTVARPLPATNWQTGISWSPVCQPSYNFQLCPPMVPRELAEERNLVHTEPFTIYTPQRCTLPTDSADLESVVSRLTEAHTASALAAALWMGDGLPYDPEIPTLRRAAIDVSSGAAIDLDDGVSQLLTHYEMATGGLGGAVLHLPAELMTYALGGGGGGARLCWPEGNLYRGPLGSAVSPGPGYPHGFSPDGPDGHGPLLDAGPPEEYAGNEMTECWIYVSGPVEYAVGAVRTVPEDEWDRIPFRQNLYEVWGEREAIVRFDPCTSFATLVTNPSPMVEVS